VSNHLQYHPTPQQKKTAVTLVVHGFNNRPAAMLPLIQWLNSQGSDVWLVSLTGHRESATDLANLTSTVWQQEMLDGYEAAKNAAAEQNVPLYFLGYSLGALLGQTMLVLPMKSAPFDKQVLLAPAIAFRRRASLLRFFFFLGWPASLPSFTPAAYRVNRSLPLSAYRVLFGEEAKLQKAEGGKLNFPTLVLLDPKDELISFKRLLQLIGCFGLTKYRVVRLNDQLKGRKERYHHLILDEQTMGKENWALAMAEIRAFLF
jgi:hypothetical protein